MTLEIQDFLNKHNYPLEYFKLLELGLLNLNPWQILNDVRLITKHEGISERYPNHYLLPIALRLDCDDVACWDVKNRKVLVIHDYSSKGWDRRVVYDNFWDWFLKAINDMIEFTQEDIEYEQKHNT